MKSNQIFHTHSYTKLCMAVQEWCTGAGKALLEKTAEEEAKKDSPADSTKSDGADGAVAAKSDSKESTGSDEKKTKEGRGALPRAPRAAPCRRLPLRRQQRHRNCGLAREGRGDGPRIAKSAN